MIVKKVDFSSFEMNFIAKFYKEDLVMQYIEDEKAIKVCVC